MENAADALKIAFAIFVFILAITITFSIISKANATSNHVLYYTDQTNFYQNKKSETVNRKVSLAEVISTLYRYNKESLSVTFKLNDGTYVFDLGANKYEDKKILKASENDNDTAITNDNLEETLKNFIAKKLVDYSKFTEEFVETSISGQYITDEESGERKLRTADSKKVYVIYTPDES